jgi:hypothetical protein
MKNKVAFETEVYVCISVKYVSKVMQFTGCKDKSNVDALCLFIFLKMCQSNWLV